MILTKPEILKKLKGKEIIISPLDKKSVGPASVDLTLDKEIRIFDRSNKVIDLRGDEDYKKITKLKDISQGYVLNPGELILGITKETITLPGNICGWLNSRSRYARLGLMSHITAPFICPGISNRQVLEVYNAGTIPIKLHPGIKICQIVFETCEGKSKYQGKFKNQKL
ncbi:MAG: dCTP deaminase [archaeon]